MRNRRIAAASGTAAVVAATILLGAAPASAETVIENVTFYGETDFGVEDAGYPMGVDWFFGDDGDPNGTAEFTPVGLEINGSGTPGVVQILNQNVTTPATANELADLVADVEVYADGDWTFQLPLFADGTTEFTTLRPAASNTLDAATWITSRPIIGTGTVDTPQYAAGATDSLGNLLAAIYDNGTPTLLAYGLWFGAADTTLVFGITWGENENGSDFASLFFPAPERSVVPTTLTPEETATTGITISGTGPTWNPEGYFLDIHLCEGGSEPAYTETASYDSETFVLSVEVVFEDPLPTGEYCVVFDDDSLLYSLIESWNDEEVAFTFVVAEAEVAAPTLPATGVDGFGFMFIATGLVAAGAAALAVVRIRASREELSS